MDGVLVDDVRIASVGKELRVEWHIEVVNGTIAAKDVAKMAWVHVLGQLFDNNLAALRWWCW